MVFLNLQLFSWNINYKFPIQGGEIGSRGQKLLTGDSGGSEGVDRPGIQGGQKGGKGNHLTPLETQSTQLV